METVHQLTTGSNVFRILHWDEKGEKCTLVLHIVLQILLFCRVHCLLHDLCICHGRSFNVRYYALNYILNVWVFRLVRITFCVLMILIFKALCHHCHVFHFELRQAVRQCSEAGQMSGVSQRLNSQSTARGLAGVRQTSKRDRILHELTWTITLDTSQKLQQATFPS